MKKAMMPLLIVLGVLLTMLLLAWWYDVKSGYGVNGPFKSHHAHGGQVQQDEPVLKPKPKQ